MLLSLIVAIALFSFFIPTVLKVLDQKQRLYIGLVGDHTISELPPTVAQLLSSGLTTVADDGSILPSVAERWSVEQDGLAYRFVLKKNLVWHDGKQFAPDDVNYNFRDVEVVTTPNDVVFKLPDKYVPFPSAVSAPLIRYAEVGQGLVKKQIPVGLGQYTVLDYTQNDQRLEEIILDHPDRRLIFRIYLTEEDAVTAFKHGKIDIIPDLTQRHDVFDWPTVISKPHLNTDQYVAVFFDTTKPMFDKNIRQALAYSLIKPTDQTRAIGPINPESWVFLDSNRRYEFDPARALERAFAQLPPTPLEFELTTTPTFEDEAEEIKATWEAFGEQAVPACQQSDEVENKDACGNLAIKIDLKITNFPSTDEFDTLLIGQKIPSDPDQYYLWHSDQPTNFTAYKNTRIDALLERGRTTTDATERKAIYQEFQQFFLEDAPAIFIKHVTTHTLSRDQFGGLPIIAILNGEYET